MKWLNSLPPPKTTGPLYPRSLELAPEGWRECMNIVAEGLAELDDKGMAHCMLCGEPLSGGRGHLIDCQTMKARRMQDAEPCLKARHYAVAVMPGVDIDAVHAKRPKATSQPASAEA